MTDEAEYGLVMPFVVCTSSGGPYDDASFVAGARFADIQNKMASGHALIESYENPQLMPQIDLLAMKYGYTIDSEPWDEHPDEWELVTMKKMRI